jgi:hypothetical protein
MSGKKIKVLHAITRLDRGGLAENTLLTVSQANMDRYEVSLVAGPTEDQRSSTEVLGRARGVHMPAAPHLVRNVSPFADLHEVWELWRLMWQGRFDIVHTHTSKVGLLGRLAARLAGWRQDVYAVLAAMGIFALPSLNEGMGKALVEAMYARLPCVATRVGGCSGIARR